MPRLWGACGPILLVGVALLLAVSPALADPLDKAKTAIDDSDYFSARSSLDEALRTGTNRPDKLAEIHRLSGIVAAALGDQKEAQAAFQRALALQPTITLPAGTSPKISKPFEKAQAFFKDKQALQIKTATGNEPPSVTIDVVADPLNMIAKLQATVVIDGKPEKVLDKPVAGHVTIELGKGKRIDLRVAALDDKGNHLVEVGTKEVPIVIVGKVEVVVVNPNDPKKPPPKPKKLKPYNPRPLYLQWWLWGGAAVAVGGVGGYFGVDSVRKKGQLDDLNAESSNHTFDEAKALEDKTRRSVLFTNIGLISGGVFALTASVLYLTRPKRPLERPMAIAPTVNTSGVGIAIGGGF